MSEIQKLTGFIRNELPKLNQRVEACVDLAHAVGERTGNVIGHFERELKQADRDITELEAMLGQPSNYPPDGEKLTEESPSMNETFGELSTLSRPAPMQASDGGSPTGYTPVGGVPVRGRDDEAEPVV
jgi:hypothetical protein